MSNKESGEKSKKLVIFGLEDFADIAYEYFTYDSTYDVVAFTVDKAYLDRSEKFNLPVVAFEELEKEYPPAEYELFAAIVYGNLNKIRADICKRAKAKGYSLASYISSNAFVWRNVKLGEHCFIFEDNTIQPFVEIGDNVVLWSGNHIGHHSKIGNHCFITSHVVVSGWNTIGDNCFIGVNSALANNCGVGDGCWISHGSVVNGEIPSHSLVKNQASEFKQLNEAVLFRTLARISNSR